MNSATAVRTDTTLLYNICLVLHSTTDYRLCSCLTTSPLRPRLCALPSAGLFSFPPAPPSACRPLCSALLLCLPFIRTLPRLAVVWSIDVYYDLMSSRLTSSPACLRPRPLRGFYVRSGWGAGPRRTGYSWHYHRIEPEDHTLVLCLHCLSVRNALCVSYTTIALCFGATVLRELRHNDLVVRKP